MARLLAESPTADSGVPETLQALIAARIDRLPVPERHPLRVAAYLAADPGVGEHENAVASDLKNLS